MLLIIHFYKESTMYQISQRKEGQCDFCNSKEEVVTLTKNGNPTDYCKTHLWQSLKTPTEKKPKVKAETK